MTKLVYPVEGIYNSSASLIDSCAKKIWTASVGCDFDIPSDFSHRGYLQGLGSLLSGYVSKTRTIESKIQKSNNYYEKLENDLHLDVKNMEVMKLEYRDRMIV